MKPCFAKHVPPVAVTPEWTCALDNPASHGQNRIRMNLYSLQVVLPTVSTAALLLLASCASKPDDEKNTSAVYRQGVPGGTWVESYKIPVTIAAIDPAN